MKLWFSSGKVNLRFAKMYCKTYLNQRSRTSYNASAALLFVVVMLSLSLNHEEPILLIPVVTALTNTPNKQPQQLKFAQHFKTKIASSEAKCERRKNERQVLARELCPNCHRPPILCVCESLPEEKIQTSTKVLVLQHPNEFKRKSLSTVPLISLVLEHCVVKVGYNFQPEGLELVQECLDRGNKPLLLFPGEDAISLDALPGEESAGGNNKNEGDDDRSIMKNQVNPITSTNDNQLLILVDGTWAEALRILKQSPELVNLCQQVQFTNEYESIYDVVRKEPQKHCISTLEACAQSLVCIEPSKAVAMHAKTSLERVMQYMVDGKRKIYEMRNPEPRFTRPGMKEAQRSEQAREFEENIFSSK